MNMGPKMSLSKVGNRFIDLNIVTCLCSTCVQIAGYFLIELNRMYDIILFHIGICIECGLHVNIVPISGATTHRNS